MKNNTKFQSRRVTKKNEFQDKFKNGKPIKNRQKNQLSTIGTNENYCHTQHVLQEFFKENGW